MQSDQGMYGIPSRESPPRTEVLLGGDTASVTGAGVITFDFVSQVGYGVTLINNSDEGTIFLITQAGTYSVSLDMQDTGAATTYYITRNQEDVSTAVNDIPTYVLARGKQAASSDPFHMSVTFIGNPGDKIRILQQNANTLTNSLLRITRLSV